MGDIGLFERTTTRAKPVLEKLRDRHRTRRDAYRPDDAKFSARGADPWACQRHLCSTVVVPKEAAQALAAADFPFCLSDRFPWLNQVVSEALMVPFSAAVNHELRNSAPQLSLAEEDHLGQTLGLDRPHKLFRVRIHIGTPPWQVDCLHAGRLEDLLELPCKNRASVVDRVPLVPQKSRDLDSPRAQPEHERNVVSHQPEERHHLDREQVCRREHLPAWKDRMGSRAKRVVFAWLRRKVVDR